MQHCSDADLLMQDFSLVGRPETSEPDLSTAKPPANAQIRFTRDYNITPPLGVPNRTKVQPFVWCCLCQEPTHWIGWVAEYEEAGHLVRCLVGKDCAKRKGGDVVRRAVADYDIRRRRAEALQARQAVLPLLTPVREALETWGSSPGVAAVMEWRAQVRNLAEEFFKAIDSAARASPPILLLEEEVRDHAAETNRSLRRGKDCGPIYKTEYKRVGRVDGASLYAAVPPTLAIRRLIEKLDTATAFLRRPTDGAKVQEIEAGVRQIREVAEGARDLQAAFSGYEKGLEADAVSVLVKWFNALPKREWGATTVRQEGRRLVVDREYGARTTATIPEAAPIVAPEIVEHLRAALLGHKEKLAA